MYMGLARLHLDLHAVAIGAGEPVLAGGGRIGNQSRMGVHLRLVPRFHSGVQHYFVHMWGSVHRIFSHDTLLLNLLLPVN